MYMCNVDHQTNSPAVLGGDVFNRNVWPPFIDDDTAYSVSFGVREYEIAVQKRWSTPF